MRKGITPSERQIIYNKYNGHCAYCGQKITRKNFHVDHALPSCGSCARYKSAYDLETFRRMLSKLPDRLKRDSGIYKIALRFGIIEEHREPIRFYFEQKENK